MATAKQPIKTKGKSAASQAKILRIGIIQAGKIIEERLIRKREKVTIGVSQRNTIVVPASSLPRMFTLFEIEGNQYSLRFGENMDGRISLGKQVMSLDQVRKDGHAKPKGAVYELPLTENTRGKVLLGDTTLLFQFVTPPPVQPRPQLPPSIRGSFFSNVDWVLASCFITMAVLHFGFLVYLRTLDFPRKIEPDDIPDRFADYIPEVEKPKEVDLSKLSNEGEKAVKKEEDTGAKKAAGGQASAKKGPAKPCDKACQEARAAERRARIAEKVSRMGVLKILGAKGAGAGGTAGDLIGSGSPDQDAEKAFSGVGGLTVAGSGGGGAGGLAGKGGGGGGHGVDIDGLGSRVGGPGEVGTGGKVVERVPTARAKADKPDITEGTMNSDATYQVIKRGMSCVRATYQRTLKRDPKLQGKVSICFNVDPMGRVTGINVESDTVGDPMLVTGIKSCVGRLRFPPPRDGSAEVCVPFILTPSQ